MRQVLELQQRALPQSHEERFVSEMVLHTKRAGSFLEKANHISLKS